MRFGGPTRSFHVRKEPVGALDRSFRGSRAVQGRLEACPEAPACPSQGGRLGRRPAREVRVGGAWGDRSARSVPYSPSFSAVAARAGWGSYSIPKALHPPMAGAAHSTLTLPVLHSSASMRLVRVSMLTAHLLLTSAPKPF